MSDPQNLPEEDNASAPVELELEQDSIYGRYLLHSRTEIIFVLRAAMQKGSMITAHFDEGKSFLLTALLDVDADKGTLVFDLGSDRQMNERALRAKRIIFTTALDKVKIQFRVPHLESVKHGGRMAFRSQLPTSLLRLQRREYYRLVTPVATPIICQMLLSRSPQAAPAETAVPLLDISGGGVGLLARPELEGAFQVGDVFTDCRIELPEEGLLVCNLAVRNKFHVTTKSGNQHLRVGCEFDNLPGTRLSMVQRYITRVERERKARAAGLD